jgi:hypothetical protein
MLGSLGDGSDDAVPLRETLEVGERGEHGIGGYIEDRFVLV